MNITVFIFDSGSVVIRKQLFVISDFIAFSK